LSAASAADRAAKDKKNEKNTERKKRRAAETSASLNSTFAKSATNRGRPIPGAFGWIVMEPIPGEEASGARRVRDAVVCNPFATNADNS
jgi:hypothetical protein